MDLSKLEEIMRLGILGIKRVKRQKKFSKLNHEDSVLSDVDGGRFYVPGQGIIEALRETEAILDCGHSSINSIGHVANCGHVVCRLCVEKLNLMCAEPGCFRKLCTVKGCANSARVMIGVYFCKKHQLGMFVTALSNMMFHGRLNTQRWMDEIQQAYYAGHKQYGRKELPDAEQWFPG